MTTATAAADHAYPASGTTGFGRLLKAEWTKIRSVRSTLVSLGLLVVLTLGFTALVTGLTIANWSKERVDDKVRIVADPVAFILGGGFQLSQLTVCVLGVMVIATEYSTGMIRASLLAVPKRVPMLAAKGLVLAALVFVVAELVAFPSFFLGAAIIHSKVSVSISDPGVLRAVIGAGLYLLVLSLFAMAIGEMIRHTAGAITGVIGIVLVLVPITQLLPGSFGDHVHAYMPTAAGVLIGEAHRSSSDLLTPWQGFGVFCLWTAVLLAIAAYLLHRRDAK